jgi:mannose-6-phosphate isomerase-like protein (cupin superfamily)
MTQQPVSLAAAFSTFDDLWSPRIVTSVNDYEVRIAKANGEHVWHTHDHTDEFFLVIDGELVINLRDESGERAVVVPRGSVFTVPRGTEHKPVARAGASVLMFEPTGTLTVGDRHDEVSAHVASTAGRPLQ